MRFAIDSTYCDGDIEEAYPCLFDYHFERIKNAKYPDIRDYDTCYVEIDTLEELMSLVAKTYGRVVITKGYIEIYDGYRE